jgi:hypothetical protein
MKQANQTKKTKPFFRYCSNCQEKYHPATRYQKLCLKCFDIIQRQNRIKINETRRKWQTKYNKQKSAVSVEK